MPGPYVNQAPVDDSTDMGNDNARPQGADPQTMGILQRILSLLEAQAQQQPPAAAPQMPPGMGGGMGGGMDGGMGGGMPPGMPPMGGGPGMAAPMPSPGMGLPGGMPPGMPPMPGGMGAPGQMPPPPPGGPPGRGMPFTRYAAQRMGM